MYRTRSTRRETRSLKAVLFIVSMCIFWSGVIAVSMYALRNTTAQLAAVPRVDMPTPSPRPVAATPAPAASTTAPEVQTVQPTRRATQTETTPTVVDEGLNLREVGQIILAAQAHVKTYIENPSTAVFPNTQDQLSRWTVGKSYEVVTVQSTVTSDDSYGVPQTRAFVLQMDYTTGDLTYLELDGRVIHGSYTPVK